MAHVIWIVIWVVFALFLLWLFARSLRTVMKQQKAWGQFARKHDLLYQKNAWHKPPSFEGEIKGRRIRLYVDEYVDPVRRVREFRTTIEVYFRNGFPTGLAIGSRAYHSQLQDIENVQPVNLPAAMEFTGLLALARDPGLFQSYISTRLDTLKGFFGLARAERLLMGHESDGFLIVQSDEALDDVKALNARVKSLFAVAEKLEPDRAVLLIADSSEDSVEESVPDAEEETAIVATLEEEDKE